MTLWVRLSCFSGFAAVAMGAFGAHALRGRVAAPLEDAFATGVLYHLVHSVVLLALSLYGAATGRAVSLPAGLFAAGIALFSGSLYLLTLTGIALFGPVTPLGGLLLLAGWACAGYSLTK